jgi:hypothetical protein
MSIVICIKVGEGLVLAADSVTTIQAISPEGDVGIVNTYEYARKLSHIGDLPIGALTWGIELIENRNIESLLSEYEDRVLRVEHYEETSDGKRKLKPYKLEEIVKEIFDFMKKRYDEAYGSIQQERKPVIGMLVAGYSHNEFFPEEYRFVFPNHETPERIRPDKNGRPVYGAAWHGQTDAILRLYKGYDPQLRQILIKKGIDNKIIEELPNDLVKLEWPIIYDGMPLQDAIDLAEYLIKVVIGRFRFLPGPPTCGGNIDIAVITHKGFIWVRRKNWK